MPDELRLPDLSPQSYAEIFETLRDAIPQLSSNWTDYNPSDPGITLLQLLAFLAEGTYYRIDRITHESYRYFLMMAAGTTEHGLDSALQKAESDVVRRDGAAVTLGGAAVLYNPSYVEVLRFLRSSSGRDAGAAALHTAGQSFWENHYRAVTASDFERLALECTASVSDDAPTEKVQRAIARAEGERVVLTLISGYHPSYVSSSSGPSADGLVLASLAVVGLPMIYTALNGYSKLEYAVGAYVARRCLIGTPLSVRQARLDPVVATIDLAVTPGYDPARVLTAAAGRVTAMIDPVTGGLRAAGAAAPSGSGWPYGRALTGDDVAAALRGLEGLDRSQPLEARVEAVEGTRVGSAVIGASTEVAMPPLEIGLPWLNGMKLRALFSTWTIEVGLHGRVGIDTRLPTTGAA